MQKLKGITLVMFSNDFATLTQYKHFGNKVIDYVIRFHSEQNDLEVIVERTLDIVKSLVQKYHDDNKSISGRIVAFVKYFHIEKEEEVHYFHPSYKTEFITDAETFFNRHMLKICERMDSFNRHGSSFIIKNIQEIHIHINVFK